MTLQNYIRKVKILVKKIKCDDVQFRFLQILQQGAQDFQTKKH